jgi:hypothetical protein
MAARRIQHGGVMRYGILNRPPHFDVHQSGTVGNIGTQGCMFDNLIRRDPRDSGKASSPTWRIAGKSPRTARPTRSICARACSSTRMDFTSADAKATYDRICKPRPASVSRAARSSPRSRRSTRRTILPIQTGRAAPVNFMMSAFASGWNVIVSKKARG